MIKTYEYMLTDLAACREAVHEHRRDGWRLMRIAVPEIGKGEDWRLIFERDSGEAASASPVPFGHAR